MADNQKVDSTNTDEETTIEQKLDLLKIVTDLASQESDRLWSRYQMQLFFNSGILAVLGIGGDSPIFVSATAAFGILSTLLWLMWNKQSSYYNQVWIKDHVRLVESDPRLALWITGLTNPRVKKPFNGFFTEKYLIWDLLPITFMLYWVYLFTASLL